MTNTRAKAFVLVLMPFGKRFSDLYTRGIKAAIEGAGADCERVDEQIFAEPIMQRLYDQIERADIVVAEVSEPTLTFSTKSAILTRWARRRSFSRARLPISPSISKTIRTSSTATVSRT
jgi:hypothetical protein